ncbi:DUF930 domain-containing protein [Roseibium salinum]|nr:DUF930 domain-containing protein [Roseibium salinum]
MPTKCLNPRKNPELQSGAETEAEADTADEQVEEGPVDGEAPAQDFGTVGPIVTAVRPAPKPARPSAPPATEEAASPGGGGAAAGMLSARELFSENILSDPRAQTAMRGMPPGERLNLLCMTELRAQLTVTSPQPPELLPTFRPRNGNVLEPARAAFRSGGRWYDVAFRCETDRDVTRVQKFDFRIGQPIPPGEWAERGLSGF